MKKYAILKDEPLQYDMRILYPIIALKDFNDVHAGEKGGYIESEANLSQMGDAWVYDAAKVYDNAKVSDNAQIRDHVVVKGDAKVWSGAVVSDFAVVCEYGVVCGKARVSGSAKVCGRALVCGFSSIRDNAWIRDNASVGGNAVVMDHAMITDSASVLGNAVIKEYALLRDDACAIENAQILGNSIVNGKATISKNAFIHTSYDWLTVSNIGSRNATTTFFIDTDGGVSVTCGCFCGAISRFRRRVKRVHGKDVFGPTYLTAADFAEQTLLAFKGINRDEIYEKCADDV